MPKIDFAQAVTAQTRAASALAAAQAQAHARVITLIEAATATITGPVPLAEMLSWTSKEEAARRLLTLPAGETDPGIEAILGGEAAQTGETLDVLAEKIIANADAYRSIIAVLAGLRRMTCTAIDTAATPEAVQTAMDALAAELAQVVV
ncbi:hypothetical protein [Pseudotabrizicola alkalilacus]|uniref:Uncharacterized protein n=1 Tax=Pseudotabrizicola alkalilacus TaxID=2305252 RepID=A0A411Z7N5_9RHOB|nr:hypothetical protein [Pseudotabrizicola alkalilacus]RGP39053.1 hypothetical protein D1012_02780 [Pseudotabrizicola alkalilacus]